ncbi:MAG: hypothetical protein KIT74_00785 [Fimbriimonadales bacterium]|nr:hypothetical protein [Fimbriimonadales bacterium]
MATLKVYESADRVKGAGSARMPITPVVVTLSKKGDKRKKCYTTQKEFVDSLVANGGFGMFDVKIVDCEDECKAIVSKIEKDKSSKRVQSICLAEVNQTDKIRINVPVVLVVPEEVHKGEILVMRNHRFIKVRGLVSDIPKQFRVDVTGREMPIRIKAADVEVPNGLELITDEEEILYVLTVPEKPN